jgi:hypothetical protein
MSSGHYCYWCDAAWGADIPARHQLEEPIEDGERVWVCAFCRSGSYFKNYVEVFE